MRAVYTELSNFSQKEKLTNWPRGLLCKKSSFTPISVIKLQPQHLLF